jgi:hypothetical protein
LANIYYKFFPRRGALSLEQRSIKLDAKMQMIAKIPIENSVLGSHKRRKGDRQDGI